jgi:protein-S-isoprenylcysteine O-methyltransferase Ste14
MDNKNALILLAVCSGAHIVRAIYETLKHQKRLTPSPLSFMIIFANMAVLWASWFAFAAVAPKAHVPGFIRYLGLAIVAVGLAMFAVALGTIKTLETYSGGLITSGIYAKIRHPMYGGFILWIAGWPLYTQALSALLPAMPFAINILFWRHLEESELAQRFPAYAAYKRTTIF